MSGYIGNLFYYDVSYVNLSGSGIIPKETDQICIHTQEDTIEKPINKNVSNQEIKSQYVDPTHYRNYGYM